MSDYIEVDPRYEITIADSYGLSVDGDGNVLEHRDGVATPSTSWRRIQHLSVLRRAFGERIALLIGLESE